MTGAKSHAEFLAKNPAGGLPVLELDDGSYLAESVAICRYLEALYPEPNLMGRELREQAVIEMWQRRIELGLFGPVSRAFQNTNPLFAGRITQFKDYGASATRVGASAAPMAGRPAWRPRVYRGRPFYDRGHHRAGGDRVRHAGGGTQARSCPVQTWAAGIKRRRRAPAPRSKQNIS